MSANATVTRCKELFAASDFAACKAAVETALADASFADDAATQKDLKLLLRKCNTHLLPTVPVTPPTSVQADQAAAVETGASNAPSTSGTAPSATPATTAVAAPPRFEWFQTPTAVTLTFYVKNRTTDDVAVHATDRSVEITIQLGEGREYQYHVDRLFAVVQTPATVSVRSMKVEVTLQKTTSFHWPTLEVKDDDVVRTIEQPQAVAAAVAPSSSKELAYPNSKGRNWSNFKVEEEEEKPEGDAALNALFKQIYGNGTDEQRKAMIKSFTESNGTVLSTNWSEVGTKKVVGEPPKGMEAKPFEA